MKEIQKPNNLNQVASTQQHATETTGARRQQPQIASTASEIGAHAVRRGVHFNLHNDNSVNEQIRTYVPRQRETTQSIAQGDKEGKVLVNKRKVLSDLLQNIASTHPSIEKVLANKRNVSRELLQSIAPTPLSIEPSESSNTQQLEGRWSDSISRPQPGPARDTAMSLPARSSDQTSSSRDTAMSPPARSSNQTSSSRDTAMSLPARSSDQTSSSRDTAMSLPARSSDQTSSSRDTAMKMPKRR